MNRDTHTHNLISSLVIFYTSYEDIVIETHTLQKRITVNLNIYLNNKFRKYGLLY